MRRKKYLQSKKKSFYDDTFSYLNLDSTDNESLYEQELKMDNLLEDYNIRDLDLSDLDDDIDDELFNS